MQILVLPRPLSHWCIGKLPGELLFEKKNLIGNPVRIVLTPCSVSGRAALDVLSVASHQEDRLVHLWLAKQIEHLVRLPFVPDHRYVDLHPGFPSDVRAYAQAAIQSSESAEGKSSISMLSLMTSATYILNHDRRGPLCNNSKTESRITSDGRLTYTTNQQFENDRNKCLRTFHCEQENDYEFFPRTRCI